MTGMLIPTRLPGGSQAWLDTETRDFVGRLTAFDPQLALVKNPNGSWEIWRVPLNGPEKPVMRSRPGVKLDAAQVIAQLQKGDSHSRAHVDPVEAAIKHNDKIMRQRDQEAAEAQLEAYDKMLSKAWRGPVPSNVEDISI